MEQPVAAASGMTSGTTGTSGGGKVATNGTRDVSAVNQTEGTKDISAVNKTVGAPAQPATADSEAKESGPCGLPSKCDIL